MKLVHLKLFPARDVLSQLVLGNFYNLKSAQNTGTYANYKDIFAPILSFNKGPAELEGQAGELHCHRPATKVPFLAREVVGPLLPGRYDRHYNRTGEGNMHRPSCTEKVIFRFIIKAILKVQSQPIKEIDVKVIASEPRIQTGNIVHAAVLRAGQIQPRSGSSVPKPRLNDLFLWLLSHESGDSIGTRSEANLPDPKPHVFA